MLPQLGLRTWTIQDFLELPNLRNTIRLIAFQKAQMWAWRWRYCEAQDLENIGWQRIVAKLPEFDPMRSKPFTWAVNNAKFGMLDYRRQYDPTRPSDYMNGREYVENLFTQDAKGTCSSNQLEDSKVRVFEDSKDYLLAKIEECLPLLKPHFRQVLEEHFFPQPATKEEVEALRDTADKSQKRARTRYNLASAIEALRAELLQRVDPEALEELKLIR